MVKSCKVVVVVAKIGLPKKLRLLLTAIIIGSINGVLGSKPQFRAMFVFGDSLIDNGNNNFLINSFAKSNFLPYGIDFYGGPTGRFCNGKTIVDFLGDLVGLPLLPSFAMTSTIQGQDILNGVNYASAAAGILDETGQRLGDRFTLKKQVENFGVTLNQLRDQMKDAYQLKIYLERSLVVMNLGNNDYINNYLFSIYSTSDRYNTNDFADLLIKNYTQQILELYNLGLRKFVLAGIGPLGCIPNQLAINMVPQGKCAESVNDMVKLFNEKLKVVVDQLNQDHSNNNSTIFVYGNTYGAFQDILLNPSSYGFVVTDRGCCGMGRNNGEISCLPLMVPCLNRDQYIFWDAHHPTQAFNSIIAQRAYSGPPSFIYPLNIKQMALLY